MRRRTGTVIEHGSHFDVRITLPNGQRSRRACLPAGLTRDEAKREAERLSDLAAATGATLLPRGKPSEGERVHTWARRWFDARAKRGLDVGPDRGRWSKWIDAAAVRPGTAFGTLAMDEVTTDDVEAVVATLDAAVLAGELAWKSATNAFGLLTKALDDAARAKDRTLRVLTSNPALRVRGPDRGAKKAKTCLWPDEIEAALACDTWPVAHRVAVAVAAYAGMRSSELAALRWADVDLAHGRITVNRGRRMRGAASGSTKSGAPREVTIERELLPLLELLRRGKSDADNVLVVPDMAHEARWLRQLLRDAGVTRAALFESTATHRQVRFHDLKASWVTLRLVRGDAPFDVMTEAAHEDFATTQHYIRDARTIRGMRAPFGPLPASFLRSVESSSHGAKVTKAAGNKRKALVGEVGFEPLRSAPHPFVSARVASGLDALTRSTSTPDERERAPLDAREPALDALELRRIGLRVGALH